MFAIVFALTLLLSASGSASGPASGPASGSAGGLSAWSAVASSTSSTSSTSADPCDRRADIVALRQATAAERAVLRKRFDEQFAAANSGSRADGCAAAVAAEAAILDGDKGRTLLLLDNVVHALPELASSLLPHRALLYAELGQMAGAEALLAGVPLQQAAWRARVELALARARNDKSTTTALLEKAASHDPRALDALCAQGQRARCVDLLVRFAGHPLARAREDAVDVAGFGLDAIDARLKGLLAAARPKRVVAEGERWLSAHGGSEKPIVGQGRVVAAVTLALLRLNLVTEAVARSAAGDTRMPVSNLPQPVRHSEGAVTAAHAKALSRAGRYADAAAVWHALATGVDPPTTGFDPGMAEAGFFSGFSFVEGDDVDAALAAFAAHAQLMQGSPWEVQALWQQAFLLLTAKQDASSALAHFEELVARNDKEVRKHRYWRARALDVVGGDTGGGAVARAKKERQSLIAEDALDWYGQLARRDLGLAPLTGKALAADALQKLIVDDDDSKAVRLLFALGFDDEASDRCRARALGQVAPSIAPSAPTPLVGTPAGLSAVPAEKAKERRASLADIGLCQAVDDATFGWRRGGLYLPVPPVQKIGQNIGQKNRLNASSSWRVSYAMPWVEVVDEAARVNGVPRSFVYAIMRTESGFAADAVSVAGARGALQLLPSVARAVGERVPHSKSGGVDDDIQLGAGLLGLLHKEHGSLLLAAAAYNGAPEQAQSWVKRFGTLPVDVFVERVPFRETRDYIKRVLAVEAVYRGLDGGEASLSLPSKLAPATSVTLFPYDE